MHTVDPKFLLMIEPSIATREPIIDSLTRRMTAAFRGSTPGPSWRGWHDSTAKPEDVTRRPAKSDSCNFTIVLTDGTRVDTNSLCIHYVAHCRSQIPPEEIAKLDRLPAVEDDPDAFELWPNGFRHCAPHVIEWRKR